MRNVGYICLLFPLTLAFALVRSAHRQVLSRKLTQRYFRGSLYMETDVEVGSSVAAESVVSVFTDVNILSSVVMDERGEVFVDVYTVRFVIGTDGECGERLPTYQVNVLSAA